MCIVGTKTQNASPLSLKHWTYPWEVNKMKGGLKINGNEAKVKMIILITIWDTEGEDSNKGVGST